MFLLPVLWGGGWGRLTDYQLVTVHPPPCIRQNIPDTSFNVSQVNKE